MSTHLPSNWRTWPEERKRLFLARLRVRAAAWQRIARPAQRPPLGDWYIWALIGGRGSGKTRAGVEWLADELEGDGPGDESAIVAPTFGDARDTCVEGPSGLLEALGRRGVAVAAWNRSLGELRLGSGAVVRIDGADDGALRLQGHNFRRALCDELGLWREGTGERAWEESLLPAVRLGDPRIVVATTPKPTPLLRGLLQDSAAVITRMTTFDNEANLAASFIAQMRARYEGTRLGRQELWGELVDEVEGALWRRAWFERDGFRATEPPLFWPRAKVIGVDPADGSASGDEQAYTVAGLGSDHLLYVIESEGLRTTVYDFAKTVVLKALEHEAIVVLERNAGHGWLEEVFHQVMRDLSVHVGMKIVSAFQGKRTRAEPVAALYERERVRHLGRFAELEEQMASFTGVPGQRSPDRLDSAVWALSTFSSMAFGPEPMPVPIPYTDRVTDPTVVAWR